MKDRILTKQNFQEIDKIEGIISKRKKDVFRNKIADNWKLLLIQTKYQIFLYKKK